MTGYLSTLAWPGTDLSSAIEALARKGGLSPREVQVPAPPKDIEVDPEVMNRWITAAANWLGVEAEPIRTTYGEAVRAVARASPSLLRIPDSEPARFFVFLRLKGRIVSLLRPDLRVAHVRRQKIDELLCHSKKASLAKEVDGLLSDMDLSPARKKRVREAITRQRLRSRPLGDCWLFRLAPGSRFWAQLLQAKVPQRLLLLASTYTIEYLLWILSWWLVGRAALEGWFDYGWLLGWALLLLTLVPFLLFGTWLQGEISISVGALLKRRLLCGALRLEPEEIRHQGIGQFLGRVMESDAVESLALSGGFLTVVAAIELAISTVVLALGAGFTLVVLLLGWMVVMVLQSRRYFEDRRRWTNERLLMTHDLIEGMVGHRTRLVQEPREQWHEREDRVLERYFQISSTVDRTVTWLMAVAPRGWLVLAFLGMIRIFVAGNTSPVELAIALAGILLAYRAIKRLAAGLWNVADAAISWQQVAQLFQAAARPQLVAPPVFLFPEHSHESTDERRIIEAQDLVYRYHDRTEPVLRGCNLSVSPGERLLLEGGSGGGKSTFASLLTGMRLPVSGLLLLDGLDRNTLGEDGWRRRIVSAPQFHENHVLTGTFAFNLLMGRSWPPREKDLIEAETMCRELGLAGLLERMPAGMLQMVGETGWQLSHGERSRLFIARALLQESEMVILDESFAALDPETLRRAFTCILQRARTLMVIAHP